ncbi:MAG TPA: class I SAM-dependent methyltransferase [Fibrobacteria bacterium]|nr:class I SAM-dependent methyltransferase [Fibrobacteria bacterium]
MADTSVKFTGENFIPELSEKRLKDDHVERYRFAATVVRGAKVLDIACGPGYGSQILLDAGAVSVDGADISEKMVAHARQTHRDPRIRFQVGDICTFRGEAPYDFITCFETIEHLPQYREAIANLYTLLKPGGRLYISSPNRTITTPDARSIEDKPRNEFHTQEFTMEELKALLEERGFKIARDGVYGQRFQRHFRSGWMRKLYRMAFRPESKSSPSILALGNLPPRYFLIVAQIPG